MTTCQFARSNSLTAMPRKDISSVGNASDFLHQASRTEFARTEFARTELARTEFGWPTLRPSCKRHNV